jgi:hypothetical protein
MAASPPSVSQKRTDEILQEIRIILPGTQALLGFQFIAFFNNGFINLSTGMQLYHLGNLLLTTLCAVLLITPVALHEIWETGRATTVWVRFTRRLMNGAMFCLITGLAGDVFVAGQLIKGAQRLAIIAIAGAVWAIGMIMWFGLSLIYHHKH